MNFSFFTVFLKNRNISSNIKRSKVTDYAALKCHLCDKNPEFFPRSLPSLGFVNSLLYFLRNRHLKHLKF